MSVTVEGPLHSPEALRLAGGRRLVVEEVLDRWPGEDHLYLELRCEGGAHFILRHDRETGSWEIALFRPSPDEI